MNNLLNVQYDPSVDEQLTREAEADALKRAFGTRPRKPVKAAKQDNLFDPDPQGRLSFTVEVSVTKPPNRLLLQRKRV